MKSLMTAILVVFICLSMQAQAQEKMKMEDALKQQELLNAKTVDDRLNVINGWIQAKKISSSTLTDYLHRLWWEAVAPAMTIKEKLDKYASLKNKYLTIPTEFDFEQTLIMIYLAEDPEAKSADEVGKMKLIKRLKDTRKVGWPAAAPFSTTLIAYHLAKKPDFLTMSAKDKITYLKTLEAKGAYGSVSSARYMKSLAIQDLVAKQGEERKKAYEDYLVVGGFFTKNTLEKAFYELKQ